MYFTPAHFVEVMIVVVAIGLEWFAFRHKVGRGLLIFLTVLTAWYGVFGAFLATEITPVQESVRVTALGTKNAQSTNDHICITGYLIDGVNFKLQYPEKGKWAWYPSAKGSSTYFCSWFPGDKLQPEDATDYIVLQIPTGKNRSITFLRNPWYGIARVEAGRKTQTVDTWGNNGIANVSIPDTTRGFYMQAQWEQLPACIAVFFLLVIVTITLVSFTSRAKGAKKMLKHQFLFSELVKRDFALKYKRTVLGMVWSVLSPLLTLLIMWLVFRDILGNSINHFVIYMFIGQLVFSFFSDATTQGMTSLLDNAGIFTKINVPKYMFLLSKNVSSLINFGLTIILLFVFVALDGLPFTSTFLMLVYPISLLILFNIGLGLILSALFVFFRDMQYLWGVFTQLIMWVSAIFYSIDSFDQSLQNIFLLNPIYLFIRYFRKILIENSVPTLGFHLMLAGYTAVVLALGAWVYKKYNHEFLYYV